jgi:uncharacterized ferritin-like protein (DUF455 family)
LEIRELATSILRSESLEVKLRPPTGPLTDEFPGPPVRWPAPVRPAHLRIAPAREVKIPSIEGMADPRQRPRILHALANHELQAAELFAWALLAFADAAADFRRGLAEILRDEQRHTRMYIARLEACGGSFGDYPVSGYFWNKVDRLTSPLRFVCAMSLTFENANLDHTVDYAAAARRAGDRKTAAVIERVHRDEIEHVRFGWRWLRLLKSDEQSMWEAFRTHLAWPLRPAKAKGRRFYRRGREAADLDADFIRRLEESRL